METCVLFEKDGYGRTDTIYGTINIQSTDTPPDIDVGVVIVVDMSGSMAGEPIATIHRCVEYIMMALQDKVTASIVLFNHDSVVLRAPSKITVENISDTLNSLREVQPNGSTNIELGVRRGITCLSTDGHRQHMILLTDGDSTDGIASGVALAHATKADLRTTTVHVVGLGENVNTIQLQAFADTVPHGVHIHVQNLHTMVATLGAIVGKILTVARYSVQLTIPDGSMDNLSGLGTSSETTIKMGTFYTSERVSLPFRVIDPTKSFKCKLDAEDSRGVAYPSIMIAVEPRICDHGTINVDVQIELVRAKVGIFLTQCSSRSDSETIVKLQALIDEVRRLLVIQPRHHTLLHLHQRLHMSSTDWTAQHRHGKQLLRQRSESVVDKMAAPFIHPQQRSYSESAIQHVYADRPFPPIPEDDCTDTWMPPPLTLRRS
jgi:uncharacterized protein YegL